MLSGDLHHYARYAEPDTRQLITFGGGGAYLYATHELPKKITVPPKESIVAHRQRLRRSTTLATTYPSRMRSRAPRYRRLHPAARTQLGLPDPARHPAHAAAAGPGQLRGEAMLTLPGFLMIAVMLRADAVLRGRADRRPTTAKHYLLGLVARQRPARDGRSARCCCGGCCRSTPAPGRCRSSPRPSLYGPILAVAAAEVVALYLLIASRFGVNLNELFAGQGIQGYKGFLRLHIARDGSLTIYPIGIDSANKRWRATPTAAPTAPWIEPVKPLRPHLIEPPIQLSPTGHGSVIR